MSTQQTYELDGEEQGEEWRPIKGYEGLYEASSLGRIKSCERRLEYAINGHKTIRYFPSNFLSYGIWRYSYVRLGRRGKSQTVHRIIAQTFLPNPFNKPYVNHKNGIKTDNRVSNLEWVSAKENCLHAIKSGLYNAKHRLDKKLINGKYITPDQEDGQHGEG